MKVLSAAEAIGDGVISVPETLLDGLIRTGEGLAFWDSDEEVKIGLQNERAYKALKALFRYGVENYNSPIEKSIRIILVNFYKSLSKSDREKVINSATNHGVFVSSKLITSAILSQLIARRVSKRIVTNYIVKSLLKITMSGEFTLLSIQGLLFKAGKASDRLKSKFPKIYWEMRRNNLDMIYFLIEKSMSKYLNAIRLARMKLPIKINENCYEND